jgi:staphylococcal nuclease domain-containing protein 1
LIVLSLESIQTPLQRDNHKFFKAALAFTKEKCHQHDVEFDVVSQDTRGAGFIGNVWLGKQSLAALLLEQGFAKIFRGASRDPDMIIAEDAAKRNKLGVWKDYDEEAEKKKKKEREENDKEKRKPRQEYMDVIVTEIVDGCNFFIQIVGKEAEELEAMMKKLAVEESKDSYTPTQGELVKAQFTADDAWYRAEVLRVQDDGFKVKYVDYGNSEVIPADRIRKLPQEFHQFRHQAHEAVLAYIKTPPVEEENGKDAAEYFKELVWGKTMMANVENKDPLDTKTRYHLSLGDRESQVHVNAALLRAGLAKVERVRGRAFDQIKELINKLREEESKAREAHLGIWEYGDPGSDDEDEDKRAKKRT